MLKLKGIAQKLTAQLNNLRTKIDFRLIRSERVRALSKSIVLRLKGIAKRLTAHLENLRTKIDFRLIRSECVRTLSKLNQWLARQKDHQRQTRERFAKHCETGLEILSDAGRRIKMMLGNTGKAVSSTRTARWFRQKMLRQIFHPVHVAERPVPTKEDPRIAKKVEEARLWMKERGIGDELQSESGLLAGRRIAPKAALHSKESDEALVPRRPPRAVGQQSRSLAKSAAIKSKK